MYANHAHFTVSAKIALYSQDKQRVLVMKYPHTYGLPGGHVEASEQPDQALQRELQEELGITVPGARQTGFFLRDGSTVNSMILAYVAVADSEIVLNPSYPDEEIGVWLTRDELAALPNISNAYKQFTFNNWPSDISV